VDFASAPGLRDGLIGLALAFVLAVALMPLAIRLAWRLGVIDRPVGNKLHARPTPLMGGLAIAIAFLAVTLLLPALHGHGANRGLIGLLAGCALATALGVVDELWTLRPSRHFLGQIGCVAAALALGFPRITQVSDIHRNGSVYLSALFGVHSGLHDAAPTLTTALGITFTLFWIVGMMNTINFLDGLDGLAGGVAAIAALFLGLWAAHMAHSGYVTHDNQNVILPLVLCGAILGFLVFNWAPARVFMGDSGAMCIGFTLGALCIFGPVKLGTALLILLVPILDVAWAIVRRLLGRRSFADGDKRHIYHRMLELGMSRRAVMLSFYALCIALGLIDLQFVKLQKLLVLLLMALLALLATVALEVRVRRSEDRKRHRVRDLDPLR
jgi:UDP-GlcNAc:undecaprenyl-phosphate/decaprenyl-phosphate GlcNAc-1-phosphate transferase